MKHIELDIRHLEGFVTKNEYNAFQKELNVIHPMLMNRRGKGSDFLGWLDLPSGISDSEIDAIENAAAELRAISQIVVVVGIGGSYLGARAVIETQKHAFSPWLSPAASPEIIYAGHQLSQDYMADLLDVLEKSAWSVIVISKSGTTTEPALAFRILKNQLEKQYGKRGAAKRIVAITDEKRGALKQLATQEGYPTFVVPDDVGGRYSVLSPVGLLPIAVAGIPVREMLKGAAVMENRVKATPDMEQNPAAKYAAVRNILYRKGKAVEFMVNYLPALYYITEWWKQLYGESEGKQNRGILPHGVSFTTDLHSMGQYIQDGLRVIFETTLSVEKTKREILIPEDDANLDGLNYLAGKDLQYVNKMAGLGTTLAHVDGSVPNMHIHIPEITPYYIGQLIYFFEAACALSGYILDVNPFDQPGVEAYKRNMFALLGKPGFEEETRKIQERIME
ncbi:MAG: glucose-6-phosphate isomerase [Bacteroidales bacterium]|nr:glucose-6-phosphate isomerase [Bacteroidales bacterium]MDY0286578.1 glucose-6-phosphate isomerase [Bacteroidales bacterium]HPE87590.1 glucose-6-phosphate isomerase [Bacteroidales bacterium]